MVRVLALRREPTASNLPVLYNGFIQQRCGISTNRYETVIMRITVEAWYAACCALYCMPAEEVGFPAACMPFPFVVPKRPEPLCKALTIPAGGKLGGIPAIDSGNIVSACCAPNAAGTN